MDCKRPRMPWKLVDDDAVGVVGLSVDRSFSAVGVLESELDPRADWD